MSKSWGDVISESRILLQDRVDPFRYADELLVAHLNQGLHALATIRPDAFWDSYDDTTDDIVVPEVAVTPSGDQIPTTDLVTTTLPMLFYSPLIFYVVGKTETMDDEFSDDSRALAFYNQFKTTVLGL